MIGGRDLASAVVLALLAAVGAIAIDRLTVRQLDQIRGMRVALHARAALSGTRPDGELTVVKEIESAKYRFLNKRVYEVDTSSAARAGSALRGDLDRDKARADRHAEARRRIAPLRTELPDGRWRVTLADGFRTAELLQDPPAVPYRAPWGVATLLFICALAAAGAVRLKLTPQLAGLAGLAVLAIGLFLLGDDTIADATREATSYLSNGGLAAPAVRLDSTPLRAALGASTAAAIALVILLGGPLGARAGRALWRDSGAYLAVGPAVLALLILVGIPFAFGLGLSLFSHHHGEFRFVGLDNFKGILLAPGQSIFRPQTLPYSLVLTIVWTTLNVGLHLGIGLSLALLLQRVGRTAQSIYRVLLIVPWAVPSYLTALIWKSMFDPDVGAVNRLLGIEGTSWMQSFPTAFLANLITNVWLGVPFMMVVCLGALTSIPSDLYEAADVDGASRFRQLVHITLPLLRPALLPAVLLGSIWTFNKFEVIYLVSEGRPDGATDILVTEAYRWAFERGMAHGGAYGYAAAYSVVIFLVLLVYGWMTSRVAKVAEDALR